MGTNYYHSTHDKCLTCGHDRGKKLHIGKSSAGWVFSLHVYPDGSGPDTLSAWQERWKTGVITDEYDAVVSPKDMLDIITNRARRQREECPTGYGSWGDFYRRNQAEPGPNNMIRHALSAGHCIGHGNGTWDYMVGDFS